MHTYSPLAHNSTKRHMDIIQLSKITGVSSRAIYHYHQLGLIGDRNSSLDHDRFHDEDIHSVKLIKMAMSAGFKIRDILNVIDAKHRGEQHKLDSALERLSQRFETEPDSSTGRALLTLKNELTAFIGET